MEFLSGLLGSKWKAPRVDSGPEQNKGGIGGYCKGRDLDECRALFGDKLVDVCATCPD